MSITQLLEHPPKTDSVLERRRQRLKGLRIQLNFDLTDGCNLNCVMCGNVPNRTRANQHVMPIELFQKNLVSAFGLVQDFSYGCYFEPTMTPYFPEALAAISGQLQPGVRGSMTTNGTLFTDANIKAIVDSDIFHRVRVSIDAASEELFDRIRKGARFNRVIANIKNLVAYAREQNSVLKVEFNFTKMRGNIHELPAVISLAKDCGADSVTTHKLAPGDCGPIDKAYYDRLAHYVAEAKARAKDLGIAYGGQDDYRLEGDMPQTAPNGAPQPAAYACEFSKRWLLLTLNPRGEVTIPCRHAAGTFGNLASTPLDQLLVSDRLTNLLDRFDAPIAEVCGPCIYYRPLPAAKSANAAPAPSPQTLAARFFKQADQAYARGDLPGACEFLEQGLLNDPQSAPLHVCLGNIRFQLNDSPAALQEFRRADHITPRNVDVLIRLAAAARQCGETQLAEQTLEQALQLANANPAALQLMGHLRFDKQLYAQAALQYCAALPGDADNLTLLSHLGKCQFELGDLASARWAFQRALELDPANAGAKDAMLVLSTRGFGPVIHDGGSSETAESNPANSLTPAMQNLLSHTQDFCGDRLDHEDYAAAWQALCRATRLAPNHADTFVFRGQLALFLNKIEIAQNDFARALTIDSKHAAAKDGLARCRVLALAANRLTHTHPEPILCYETNPSDSRPLRRDRVPVCAVQQPGAMVE